LFDELRRVRPDIDEPLEAIASGLVTVDGVSVTNPGSRVRPGCSIVVAEPKELRGSAKLRFALDRFGIDVEDMVALDVGAAAGGFTTVLLERGAAKVYAVDAGHGQLLGSLQQDPRVVNLERTNIADVKIPEPVDFVVIDVSYLALRDAVAQLDRVEFRPAAALVGLVKPMFELRLASAPTDEPTLDGAIAEASAGVETAGWSIAGSARSPVLGAKGALEGFVFARVAGGR